ncbi:hypothetical protein H6F76_04540 [Leptolyngbya sp. FACHB-321]|uniref:hypothetical protein n=1 Tax=Leptolyngbya sp. FACHB-321 TaxID=2692807 RepID=UPI00168981AD|nr:hypothetical protein [Leptolyngbya sp. FACHB-321]MBD2034307.1 hypothetical protein [Leptolyngbya sp. FACHB-321]
MVWAAFQRQYRAVVQDLTAAWGVPSFEGTWETAGFPTWAALGTQLAYWQRRGALAYVACDRPEPEVELTLVLGARASLEDYTEADWFATDYW